MIVTVIKERTTKGTMSEASYVELLCKDAQGRDYIVDPFITAYCPKSWEDDIRIARDMVGKKFDLTGDFVFRGVHLPTAFTEVVTESKQYDLFNG